MLGTCKIEPPQAGPQGEGSWARTESTTSYSRSDIFTCPRNSIASTTAYFFPTTSAATSRKILSAAASTFRPSTAPCGLSPVSVA